MHPLALDQSGQFLRIITHPRVFAPPTSLSRELEVPGLGKLADFVPNLLPALPAEFQGTLHLIGDRGFSMLGLRQRLTGTLSILTSSDRAFAGSLPLRFIVATRNGLMHVTSDGQVNLASADRLQALQVRGAFVYGKAQHGVQVRDSAYRLIRIVEVDPGIGFSGIKALPDDRFALIDNISDQVHIVDLDGNLLASVDLPSDEQMQNVDSLVVGDDLIISDTGDKQLFLIDLRTYEGRILRDCSAEVTGYLGPLAYSDGFFYLATGGYKIYRFTENGPIEQVAVLPGSAGIVGIEVVGQTAYVGLRFEGTVRSVDLQSGESQIIAAGLDSPDGFGFAPGTAQ